MRRRFATVAVLVAGALFGAPTARAQQPAETVIEGGYEFVADRLRPEPRPGVRTRQQFRVVLSGRNEVDETWVSRNARGRRPIERQRTRALGGEGEGQAQWRVAGPNRLTRIADSSQSVTTLTVTVNPDKSCALAVTYKLKPGFREFRFRRRIDRTWGYYANARAENLVCSIK